MPDLPDAPWAVKPDLPDAPWAAAAKPPVVDKPYFGMIPMAKGLYKAASDAFTLPGDVYAGRTQVPSKAGGVPGSAPLDSPEGQEGASRIANMALLTSPMVPKAGSAAMAAVTPTREAIHDAAVQGFDQAKNMGVDIAPAAVKDIGAKLEAQLQQKGILEEHAPATYATIKRLQNPPSGSVSTISDLHNLRQAFGNAAGDITKPKDALAGSMGKSLVDDFLSAIPEKAVLAGDAPAASATLKDAIGNYAASARSEDVGARLTRAERQAAKSGSGSNIDNAIRQKISAILDVPSRTRGFSPEEIAQMEEVVRGTTLGNIARKVGKLGVSDGLSLLLHAGMAAGTGGATIPIAAAGTASRKIAEMMTQRGANKLDEMIRARSPLAQSGPEAVTEPSEAFRRVLQMMSAPQLAQPEGRHP